MNTLVKSDGRALQRFECHCPRNISKANKLFRAIKRKRPNRSHRLRSVEKRETLFYFQLQRRNLRAFQGNCRRQPLALIKNFSFANRCECQMGKWREIATRANASFFGNDWRHAFFKHRDRAFQSPKVVRR